MPYQKQVAEATCSVIVKLAHFGSYGFADKKSKKKVGKAAAAAPPDIFVGLYAGPSLER